MNYYQSRHELEAGQVFTSCYGPVKLDRRVPGDGTQWYVAIWLEGYELSASNRADPGWCYDDTIIEPGDLRERIADPKSK